MDPNKQTEQEKMTQTTLHTHDIDLVAIFKDLLLQDLQTDVDKYGSYGKWLLAKKQEN